MGVGLVGWLCELDGPFFGREGDDGVGSDDDGMWVSGVDGEALFAGESAGGLLWVVAGEGVLVDLWGVDGEGGDEGCQEVFPAGRGACQDNRIGEVDHGEIMPGSVGGGKL